MKIPGYKHLVEDVLPDLNNYIPEISRSVLFTFGRLAEVTKDNVFVFRDSAFKSDSIETKFTLEELLRWRSNLKCILSWYLWAKYTKGGHEICTETYKDCHYLLPGEPPTDPNPDSATRTLEELDGRYITIFHRVKKFDGIGMTEESIPSKALDPIEVASWPLKVK